MAATGVRNLAASDRMARGEVPFASAPSVGAMRDKLRDVPREYRDQVGERPGGAVSIARTEDGRNERIKQRIDHSTPEERSMRAEYRRAMGARRRQLGL